MFKQYKSVIFFLVVFCSSAYAAEAEIQVTASVNKFCTARATPLNFGIYAFKELSNRFTVTVTCTAGTQYYIGVSPSRALFMRNSAGNDTLSYSLFQDTTRSLPLGNRVGLNTISGIGTGLPQTVVIFAHVASNQAISDGQYQDRISVTLSF